MSIQSESPATNPHATAFPIRSSIEVRAGAPASIECPTCGAAVRHLCFAVFRGVPKRDVAHTERVEAALRWLRTLS